MPNVSYYYHPDNFIDSLAGADRIICPNQQANLGASGNDSIWASYFWEPSVMVINANNANTLTVPLSANQQFILSVVNNCGDTIKTDTVWVSQTCFPLPVKLGAFNIECHQGQTNLNWSTYAEKDNDYFTIERGTDAVNFEPIATVSGNGNSNAFINYTWTDNNPINGNAYYRLKQTDFNEAYEYLGVRTISCEQGRSVSIYPNPFTNSFTVQLSENASYPLTVEVLDYLGRKVHYATIGTTTTEIVLNQELPTGTYFVKVFNETTQVVERIVKMK